MADDNHADSSFFFYLPYSRHWAVADDNHSSSFLSSLQPWQMTAMLILLFFYLPYSYGRRHQQLCFTQHRVFDALLWFWLLPTEEFLWDGTTCAQTGIQAHWYSWILWVSFARLVIRFGITHMILSKLVLIDSNVLLWFLIGWQHSHQPIKTHVRVCCFVNKTRNVSPPLP